MALMGGIWNPFHDGRQTKKLRSMIAILLTCITLVFVDGVQGSERNRQDPTISCPQVPDSLVAIGASVGFDPICQNREQNRDTTCLNDECRLCALRTASGTASSFLSCSLLVDLPQVGPTLYPNTGSAPGLTAKSQSSDGSRASEASDASEASASQDNLVDSEASRPDSPLPPSKRPSEAVCGATLSPGDRAAGIMIIGDATCVQGGLGCFDVTCRFCKVRDTLKSTHLHDCSEFEYYFGDDGENGSSSGSSTKSNVLLDVNGCANRVTPGDVAVGVSAVTDTYCVTGGLGCFGPVCRYCKVMDTPQSHHLHPCSAILSTLSGKDVTAPVVKTEKGAMAINDRSNENNQIHSQPLVPPFGIAAVAGVVAVFTMVALLSIAALFSNTRSNRLRSRSGALEANRITSGSTDGHDHATVTILEVGEPDAPRRTGLDGEDIIVLSSSDSVILSTRG